LAGDEDVEAAQAARDDQELVPYRLVGFADDQIDQILVESEAGWGLAGSERYGKLILAAMTSVGEDPAQLGAHPIPRVPGVLAYHLDSARNLVATEYRVGSPRHLVVYRVALDGVVEILGLVHDRQNLASAARRAKRAADEADD
jgi:toxin ParE1/3/4